MKYDNHIEFLERVILEKIWLSEVVKTINPVAKPACRKVTSADPKATDEEVAKLHKCMDRYKELTALEQNCYYQVKTIEIDRYKNAVRGYRYQQRLLSMSLPNKIMVAQKAYAICKDFKTAEKIANKIIKGERILPSQVDLHNQILDTL